MTKTIKKKFKMWEGKIVDARTKERKNYVGAPSAGNGIIKIYKGLLKRAINRKREFRTLVLGATPELQDWVLDFRGELVMVDISWDAILKNILLMKYQNHPREVIVKADWLNNPLKGSNYDVVLGDLGTTNLPLPEQNKLFKEIKRLLKPDGYVILREAILHPKRKIRKLEEIHSDFFKKKIHWFDMFVDFMFHSEVTPKCYEPKAGVYNLDELVRQLEKAYVQKRISKKSLKLCSWCKGSGVRVFWSKSKFEKLFRKHFKLIPTKQATDFKFTQDTIIFFFGKNKK